MYGKTDFIIPENIWFSLRCRCRWLRAVPVHWPEKAELSSVEFVGTQMPPMSPNGSTGPSPGKAQHRSPAGDSERQRRALLRNNSDICAFQIASLAMQRKPSLLVPVCFSFLSEKWLMWILHLPPESSKRINKCCPLLLLFGVIGIHVGRWLSR